MPRVRCLKSLNAKNMEKKKVKAMIEDAISRLAILHADEGDSYEHIIKILENALEELSKSDWISVKDKLPPYEKSVLVCNENDRDDTWFCHRSCNPLVITNVDGWCNYFEVPITHWLEVECFDNAITK